MLSIYRRYNGGLYLCVKMFRMEDINHKEKAEKIWNKYYKTIKKYIKQDRHTYYGVFILTIDIVKVKKGNVLELLDQKNNDILYFYIEDTGIKNNKHYIIIEKIHKRKIYQKEWDELMLKLNRRW